MFNDDLRDRVGSFVAEFMRSTRMEMSDEIGNLIQDLWRRIEEQTAANDLLARRMVYFENGHLTTIGITELLRDMWNRVNQQQRALESWIEADKKRKAEASIVDAPRPGTFDEIWRDLGQAAHDIKDAKNREELTAAVNLMKQCIQVWDGMHGN